MRADGGAGGNATGTGSGGGGGSGGVVFLASPELEVRGAVSARGGAAGSFGGVGGVGRIRLSTLPERCTLYGLWSPGIVSGCAPTRTDPMPGRVYIDEYPF